MMTVPEIIEKCLLVGADELFKYAAYMQEKKETAQKLIYIFSAADMIYEMRCF